MSFLFYAFFELRKIIKKNNFDIIHYFFSIPTGLLSFFQPNRIPYVVSLNGIDVPGYSPGEMAIVRHMLYPLNRTILNRAAVVTAVSKNLAQFAEKSLKIRPCDVIFNGIDIGKQSDFTPNLNSTNNIRKNLKLICVSRLLCFKRIDLIIEAIKNLSDVDLEIIGEGSHWTELHKLVDKLGLAGRVKFVGYVENSKIGGYLRNADIFILPSAADSFGIVFLEAMACGLPIIAARAGGVPEVVQDGFNGILTKPNDPQGLIDAIVKLKNSPEIRIKYGMKSLELVKKFDWNEIAESYFKIYKKAITGNQR